MTVSDEETYTLAARARTLEAQLAETKEALARHARDVADLPALRERITQLELREQQAVDDDPSRTRAPEPSAQQQREERRKLRRVLVMIGLVVGLTMLFGIRHTVFRGETNGFTIFVDVLGALGEG